MATELTLADHVQKCVESVNGSYSGAGDAVRALIQADPDATLTTYQVQRIMAAAVQGSEVLNEDKDGMTAHPTNASEMVQYKLVELAHGNQLGGDNGNWARAFLKHYGHLVTDGQLFNKFLGTYRNAAESDKK